MPLILPSEVVQRLQQAQKAVVLIDNASIRPHAKPDYKQLKQWADYFWLDFSGLEAYRRSPALVLVSILLLLC